MHMLDRISDQVVMGRTIVQEKFKFVLVNWFQVQIGHVDVTDDLYLVLMEPEGKRNANDRRC